MPKPENQQSVHDRAVAVAEELAEAARAHYSGQSAEVAPHLEAAGALLSDLIHTLSQES